MPEPGLTELQQSVADLTAVVKSLGTPSDPYYNVARFGAIPDAKPAQGVYQGFSMVAGSNHLDSQGAGFLQTDIGKSVVLIFNGGAWPPFTGPGLQNVATIETWQTADDILLSKPAIADCTGYMIWGTDNVPAFNAAIAAVQASATHAGTITGPPGQYLLASAPYSNSDGTAQDDGTPGSGLPGPVECWSGTGFNTICIDLPPWLPTEIPIQVQLVPGVSWFFPAGGVSIVGCWDGVTVDPVVQGVAQIQPVMFGATKPPTGQQGGLSYCNLDNLNLANGFIGIWNAYNVNFCEIRNLVCNTAIGMLTWAMDLGSSVRNLRFGGYAPWVNGGTWSHRSDYQLGQGGFCDMLYIQTIVSQPMAWGPIALKINQWFDEVFWRSDFTASSPDFWEPQYSPLPPNQRQTGQPNGGAKPGFANSMPYAGICGRGWVNLARDGRNTGSVRIENIILKFGYGPIIEGFIGDGSEVLNASCEGGYAPTGDPYNPSGVLKGAIVTGAAAGADLRNVSWQGPGQVQQTIYGMDGLWASGVAGQPMWITWRNCTSNQPEGAQAPYSGLSTPAGSTTALTQAMMGEVRG